MIRKIFGVIGARIVQELAGVSCFEIDTAPQSKKNITISRSFSKSVTELEELEEAVANYAARAREKMRAQGSKTQEIAVFIKTHKYQAKSLYYYNSARLMLDEPTDSTATVISKSKKMIRSLYKPQFKYNTNHRL